MSWCRVPFKYLPISSHRASIFHLSPHGRGSEEVGATLLLVFCGRIKNLG
jgi:hypothetical protein